MIMKRDKKGKFPVPINFQKNTYFRATKDRLKATNALAIFMQLNSCRFYGATSN